MIRPAVNLGTMGLGGPVASVFEDIGAMTVTILAIVAPFVAILALVPLGVGLVFAARPLSRRLLAHKRTTQMA